MTRAKSIVLAFILLLNTVGYYGIFLGLQYKHEIAMTRVIDLGSHGSLETVTLKVPVSIPYITDQMDYQRTIGQFEHNGELYRMISQRYANDTLTVVCIRDVEHKRISAALTEYVKNFSDKAPDHQTSKLRLTLINEYLPASGCLTCSTKGWVMAVRQRQLITELIAGYSPTIVHPPERT